MDRGQGGCETSHNAQKSPLHTKIVPSQVSVEPKMRKSGLKRFLVTEGIEAQVSEMPGHKTPLLQIPLFLSHEAQKPGACPSIRPQNPLQTHHVILLPLPQHAQLQPYQPLLCFAIVQVYKYVST